MDSTGLNLWSLVFDLLEELRCRFAFAGGWDVIASDSDGLFFFFFSTVLHGVFLEGLCLILPHDPSLDMGYGIWDLN